MVYCAAIPLVLLALALPGPATAWWRDTPVHERGDPPYPYPADRKYNPANEKTGIDNSKINVHLVPHTHDDTGWQVTVDQYFFSEVYYVVDTVVDQLLKDPNRHFIYVEIGFFARWWDEQSDERRNATRTLVQNGQLEFINGGWCMHDEASPFYVEMVDQTTRGHQFLLKNFGPAANPRGTWQIDPFGHSNTEAWLLGSEAGMESLYWGRTDYQDMAWRTSWKGQANNQWPQWIWQGSQSLGKDAQVIAGQLGNGGYGTHMRWDDGKTSLQDNPARHDYNIDQMVDQFITYAIQQQNITKTNHQMWACGSDFQYQNADHWMHNLDKIIHYVNINASLGGPVKAFYSTPSHYTDALKNVTKMHNLTWEVRTDDVFPLANEDHAYWSGYFTSRPALKRQVRFASNFLQAARQLEVITGITAADVHLDTTRPSPPVGTSWTDSFEGTIGVATHHDGMSGTERQSVSNDYSQRISESHFEVEAGVEKTLQALTGIKEPMGHCNCNADGNCLNMSVCAFTTGVDGFKIIAWNPLGQRASPWLSIPVTGSNWIVADASGNVVAGQASPIDNRTKQIPLLYINKFHMSDTQLQAATIAATNNATHVLGFRAYIPAIGYTVFTLKRSTKPSVECSTALSDTPQTVSNGIYTIGINNGMISTITNEASGITTPFQLSWGYYESSPGGITHLNNGSKMFSGQSSGAYLFRPINQTTVDLLPATLEVLQGPLYTEIRQSFSEYASHVVRLRNGSANVEVEWTAGPIPVYGDPPPPFPAPGGCVGYKRTKGCNPRGIPDPKHNLNCTSPIPAKGASGYCQCAFDVKVYGTGCGGPPGVSTCEEACSKPIPRRPSMMGRELVLKFTSGLNSHGTYYTDANGREMVKRVRNERGPSYPPLWVNEPVAGNYYPVNSMISLDDGSHEMAVITDVSMGGASITDGQLELMVHRRIQNDDHRGVQEPLNETMCGCNDIGAAPGSMGEHGHEGDGGCVCEGLTVRGIAYLVFDTIQNSHAARRSLVETLNFPPTLGFAPGDAQVKQPTYSAISNELPVNVKLLTLTSNYQTFHSNGGILLRLAHTYSVDEHPTLSMPATIDLSKVFGKTGLIISSAVETTLTGNQERKIADNRKFQWPTEDPTGRMYHSSSAWETRFPFDESSMTVTLRPMEVRTFVVTFSK